MSLVKRKTRLDDVPSTVEIMEGFTHDIHVACDQKVHTASDRLYVRLLSEVEPGVSNTNVFHLSLVKRKTGVDDTPSTVEILKEFTHDMEVVCDRQDHEGSDRL